MLVSAELSHKGKAGDKAAASRQCVQWTVVSKTHCVKVIECFPSSDTNCCGTALTVCVFDLLYLYRDVIFLVCFLWGEDIGDVFVWCGLAADSTLDGASMRPHTVLFNYNRRAFITEAVSTGQHCPLRRKHTWQVLVRRWSMSPSSPQTHKQGRWLTTTIPQYFM